MSSAKGFASSDKIVSLNSNGTKNEYNTLQPSGSRRVSIDTVNRGVTRVTQGLIVAAGTRNVPGGVPQIVTTVASTAREGDMIRFTSGIWDGWEVAVTAIVNNTTFNVGVYLPDTLIGTTFDLYRYITAALDGSGNISVNSTVEGIYQVPSPILLPGQTTQLQVNSSGALIISAPQLTVRWKAFLNYGTTPITNAAWTEVIASIGAVGTQKIQIFDSGGYINEIGIGGVGAEVSALYDTPGGNGYIDLVVPANSRISIRAFETASVNNGLLAINAMG